MEYDELGNNLIRETDARGYDTLYTVDSATSRNTRVVDRNGDRTYYEYDSFGKVTKVTSKDKNDTELSNVAYSYDAFDEMTEILRGDGMKYQLRYNALHNLESVGIEGKNESLISYSYKNGNDRLKSMTYANGDRMQATYNSLGQMIAETWYDSANTVTARYKYVYGSKGNIAKTIDILSLKEYNYTYLDDKLVKSVEYDITVNESELVTSRAAVTTILYSYDKDDNMLKKRIIFADGGEETVYYDNSDEKNEVVKFYVPDSIDSVGEFLVTSHSKTDSFGRKSFDELQHSTGTLNRRFTYLEGEVTYEHRENDRFKSLPTTQLVKEIVISSARLTEADRILSYEYDGEERITKVTDSELGVTEYTYDALGQLLTETYTNLSGVSTVINTMTYDNYGNILTKNGKVYTYDSTWKDLLTSYDGQSITYDAQGNPTTYLGHTLTWEKGRQLKSYDGITYTYNSSGMRTSKTVDGVKHEYLYDGNKLIRETWGDNTLIPLYDNEDSVCGIKYNGESYFFVKNLQGDVISIIDIYGDTKVKYTYDAWGKCSIPFDSSNILIGDINPFRYRGYYYDDETNLYYLQSRYYNPEVGRFVNCDEVSYLEINELWLSYNLYAYCENEPINNGDHSGKWLLRVICSVAAGAVFGGVALAICNLLKLTKKQKKRISLAFSALGVLLGALLGVKVITKVAPKLIKWFKKIEKKIAFSFKGKECKVGVELFSSLKIMIHRPHTKSLHKYNPIGWHVQFEIKRSGRWIVAFRIKIDKVVKWYKSIK